MAAALAQLMRPRRFQLTTFPNDELILARSIPLCLLTVVSGSPLVAKRRGR